MEQWKLEQDIDLLPHHQEVDLSTSPHPEDEQVSSDQGGTEILGGQLEGEMHTISFDDSQHRVVQSLRVSIPDDHTYPVQFEERLIMSNVRKHPITLADATRVYAEATRWNVHILIAKSERMTNEL